MTVTRRRLLAGSAALGVASVALPLSAASAQSSGGWTLLGVHPGAQAQASATGRTLIDLEVFNGMLFAGYGDYGTNSGPIAINPYGLATHRFLGTRANAYTHQIGVWRRSSYGLVAPNIDPLGDGAAALDPRGGLSWTTDGLTWGHAVVGPSYHVFDFAESPGNRWMVGSASVHGNGAPVVWRRRGSGAWAVSMGGLDDDRSVGNDRYYWIAVVGGQPYVQARGGATVAPLRRFDPATERWSMVAGVKEELHRSGQPSRVQVLGSKIISASGRGLRSYSPGQSGVTVVLMPNREPVRDLHVRGSVLHTLTESAIFRSLDGGASFEFVCDSVSDATSIAVGPSAIYVGTASSRLHSRPIR